MDVNLQRGSSCYKFEPVSVSKHGRWQLGVNVNGSHEAHGQSVHQHLVQGPRPVNDQSAVAFVWCVCHPDTMGMQNTYAALVVLGHAATAPGITGHGRHGGTEEVVLLNGEQLQASMDRVTCCQII